MPQVNDCWTETHPANPGLHASVVPDNGQLAGFHKVSSTPYGIHPIASDGAPSMFVSIIRSGTTATDSIIGQTEWAPRQQAQKEISRQGTDTEYHAQCTGRVSRIWAGGRVYHRSAAHSRCRHRPMATSHACIGLVSSHHILALVVSSCHIVGLVVLAPKSGKKIYHPRRQPMCLRQPKRGCLHPAIQPPSLGYHPCLERGKTDAG